MDKHSDSDIVITNVLPNGQQLESTADLKAEIERLSRELAAAQQERSQSAAYGLELLNDKEKIKSRYDSIELAYEQSKRDLQELREAWNKAVNEQRVSATSVFEKEVQLLNDSDALAASFTHAKQEIERELKFTKSQLDSAIQEKERYLIERDDLIKKVTSLESDRKNLKIELKDLKSRETKLFNENSELEEENVSLQKQVSNLRSNQVEFESSKHEIQRLHDEVAGLNSQLEEVVTIRRITERHMQDALEALQSEREQKYALRKELDKRNSADPLINLTSLAALRGSPHLANLALRGFSSPHRSSTNRIGENEEDNSCNGLNDQDSGTNALNDESSYDVIHELEMPSIEGSLFDEVHLTEIKKLQQNLEEKENQRSKLNTKLIEIQHKLESKCRQADEIEKKLEAICSLVEEIYNESDLQKVPSTTKKYSNASLTDTNANPSKELAPEKNQVQNETIDNKTDVVSTPNDDKISNQSTGANNKSNILDDFENVYSHLQSLFNEFKAYQELSASINTREVQVAKKEAGGILNAEPTVANIDQATEGSEKKAVVEMAETLQSDDLQNLKAMLYKKHEQLRQLRTVLKSNKESAEVALKNLKSKYDIEKAIVAETMTKLRLEHKRLNEDAATFASLRSHFSARVEEYNTEIEKLQSKLAASDNEKNTLNSILRMAVEQKLMLTQKVEALEMDRENHDPQSAGGNMNSNSNNRSANGQLPRSGMIRGRGLANRNNMRPPRVQRPNANERR